MGFWLFMLVVDLLIPLAMVAVGLWMYRRPPRKRNGFVGYRTARSRRSQQAWDFAQRHFAKPGASGGWCWRFCRPFRWRLSTVRRSRPCRSWAARCAASR